MPSQRTIFNQHDQRQIERLLDLKRRYPDPELLRQKRRLLWGRLSELVTVRYPGLLAAEPGVILRKEMKLSLQRVETALGALIDFLEEFEAGRTSGLLQLIEREVQLEIDEPARYLDLEQLSSIELEGFELPPRALLHLATLYRRGVVRVRQRELEGEEHRQRAHKGTRTRENTMALLATLWEKVAEEPVDLSGRAPFIQFVRLVYEKLEPEPPSLPTIQRALAPWFARKQRKNDKGVRLPP